MSYKQGQKLVCIRQKNWGITRHGVADNNIDPNYDDVVTYKQDVADALGYIELYEYPECGYYTESFIPLEDSNQMDEEIKEALIAVAPYCTIYDASYPYE